MRFRGLLVAFVSVVCAAACSDDAALAPAPGEPNDAGAAGDVSSVDGGSGEGPMVVSNVTAGDDFNAATDAALIAFARMYDTNTGRWATGPKWTFANDVEASEASYQRSGGMLHPELIVATYEKNSAKNFLDDLGYDDEAWWANAWVRAYDLTGEVRYLTMAKTIFADMLDAWDATACNGGIFWNRDRKYKNAITNELFLLLAASLHNRTPGDTTYRDWANKEWAWFSASTMINGSSLVNDGLTDDCKNNGQTTWTYNQGVILGALVELYESSGDASLLSAAEAIADAALAHLVTPDGVLQEPCEASGCDGDQTSFKGIFQRYLARLYATDKKPSYAAFLVGNARAVWRRGRGAGDTVGLRWSGPYDMADAPRQSSGLFALSAVAEPWTQGSAFVRASGGSSFNHAMGRPSGTLAWKCDASSCPVPGLMQSGPFVAYLPPGSHTVHFQLAVDRVGAAPSPLVTLDVRDATTDTVLARREVSWSEFSDANAPRDFGVAYRSTTHDHPVEYGVRWVGVMEPPTLTISDVAIDGERSFTAANLEHECGRLDAHARWEADRLRDAASCVLARGPGVVLEPGSHTAHFELQVDNFNLDDLPVARISVIDRTAGTTSGAVDITRGRFPNKLFQLFSITFDAVAGHRYDFETVWKRSALAPRLTQRGVYVRRAVRDVAVALPYNVRGIGTAPGDASIDAVGSAFQSTWLDGLGSIQVAGYHRFTVGSVGAGASNVLESRGADVSLPAGDFGQLHVLALAVNGAQEDQAFVVHYTDGTASTVKLSFSDWVAESRQNDEEYALAAPARWSKTGIEHGNFHLTRHAIPLDGGKTASRVTLPSNPNVKIFAATLSGRSD
jgi:predicted alpha-1,6-mannanase (GH76 family)